MNSPAIAIVEQRARPTPPGVRPVVTATVILWLAGVVAAHYAGLLSARLCDPARGRSAESPGPAPSSLI